MIGGRNLMPDAESMTLKNRALRERLRHWDMNYLGLAEHVSKWSKDPSTKTGAVIVRPNMTVASLGYNGFPRKVSDAPERYADRELKYKLIVHCEINAMDTAREPLDGYTLYTWPFTSCSRCAGQVIQKGIIRVVSPEISPDKRERWADDMALTRMMFSEAGVQVTEYPLSLFDSLKGGLYGT
jgi:dCMP deaminase